MKKLIGLAVILFLGVAASWWSISKRFEEKPLDFRARYALVAPENFYMIDMAQVYNVFKPVTNFVSTDSVFTLSNVTQGAVLICEFVGSSKRTSVIWVQGPSGMRNYAGGIQIRNGYSYLLQCFANSPTNVSAWFASDDPLWLQETLDVTRRELRASGGGK